MNIHIYHSSHENSLFKEKLKWQSDLPLLLLSDEVSKKVDTSYIKQVVGDGKSRILVGICEDSHCFINHMLLFPKKESPFMLEHALNYQIQNDGFVVIGLFLNQQDGQFLDKTDSLNGLIEKLIEADTEYLPLPVYKDMSPNLPGALFLDRDGIINKDMGYTYRYQDIEYMAGIFDLVAWAINKKLPVIVLTNQSGVSYGLYKEEQMHELHSKIAQDFKRRGLNLAGFYHSPFHPDGNVEKYKKHSVLRKPYGGMCIKACQEKGISITKSIMVGDKLSDRLHIPLLKSYLLKGSYDLETTTDVFENIPQLLAFLQKSF